MRNAIIVIVLVLSTSAVASTNAEKIFQKFSPNIVYIETNVGMGTGFLVRPSTLVTNRHVVFGYEAKTNEWIAPRNFIFKGGKSLSKFKFMICSVRIDLCIISLEDSVAFNSQPILATREVKPGEDLFVIGHPSGVAVPIISTGIASSEAASIAWDNIYGKQAKFKGFSTTAAISKGSSGSPVLSKDGEVLGITVGLLPESQNLNLVISSHEIANSLKDMLENKKSEFVALNYGFEKDLAKVSSDKKKKVEPAAMQVEQSEVPLATPDSPSVVQLMDPEIIRRILLEHLPQFRYCYQKYMDQTGKIISGTVKLDFTIGASGKVHRAQIDTGSSMVSDVKKCVIGVLRSISFPEPLGGGTVDVKQPINFYPKTI